MRGGALPFVVWATVLLLVAATNAVWTGDLIQVASFGAALLGVLTLVTVLVIRNPDALRRHRAATIPAAPSTAEAIPRASFAAAFAGLGLGVFAFGFAFGHFIVYLGAGMMLAGLGRLAGELRAQRHARLDAQARE